MLVQIPQEMVLDPSGTVGRESLRWCELRLMVCGSPDIDITELRERARYSNCQIHTKECQVRLRLPLGPKVVTYANFWICCHFLVIRNIL